MKKKNSEWIIQLTNRVQLVLGSPTFLLGGAAPSRRNGLLLQQALVAWCTLVEDVMLRQGLDGISRAARIENFLSAIEQADIVEVLQFFDSLCLYLYRHDADVAGFKDLRSQYESRGLQCGRLLSPINGPLHQFLSEPDVELKADLLSIVAQFFRFPRKLEFTEIRLEEQALEGYLETEQQLDRVACNADCILDSIAGILQKWLKGFHIGNLLPQHGSGSVSDGNLSVLEKFENCKVDTMLQILLDCCTDFTWWTLFPRRAVPDTGLERISRTIFVPKTATKLRTISMEPIALQYVQQGVMHELYRYIDTHPYMGVRIRLSDQSQNQVLAWEGSYNGSYATIDLSAASDSVSWRLVKRVFARTPLLKWLIGTRSSRTLLPNGDILPLKKFAPMGSALCFPVQCLLFAAIIEHASRVERRLSGAEIPLYSVYGDDLVVPQCIAQRCVRLLQILGFRVNTDKTYLQGRYRESCGEEYYGGHRITSVYYRVSPYNKCPSPSEYLSLCSAANLAAEHSLPTLREYLISEILSHGLRPYFCDNRIRSPHIWSAAPTNFHVRKKWNASYQTMLGRFTTVVTSPRGETVRDDDIRYHVALVQMARRSSGRPSDTEVSSEFSRRGYVVRFRTTALPITPWKTHDLSLAEDW